MSSKPFHISPLEEAILNSVRDGVIIADACGVIQKANAVAMQLLQISESELKNQTIQKFLLVQPAAETHPLENFAEENIRKRLGIAETKYFTFRKSDGSLIPVEYSTRLLHDQSNNLMGILLIFQDVSSRLSVEKNVVKQACYDYLTGLPNRSFFEETLTYILHLSKRSKTRLIVLLIDLDFFKKINEFFGHQIGDYVLKTVAIRLKNTLRKEDFLGRLGADEFVVLLEGISEIRDIAHCVEKIAKHIKEPIMMPHKKKQIHVTASIGIAVVDDPEITSVKLLSHADIAVQYCKESGRDCYHFHSSELEVKNRSQLKLEYELQNAFNQREFMLYYQPEFDMSGKLIGFETLLRWNHPKRGVLSAAEFIDTLEKTRLIIEVGRWAIKEAITQYQDWLSREIIDPSVFLALNVSAIEFETHEFVDYLSKYLKDKNIDPNFIVAEVTESSIMKDVDTSAKLLLKLHEMGFRISIDDFGKGYSSLAYLKKFPVSSLKIDGMFVKEITHSSDDLSITNAIISLGKALNLHIIAECVETTQQLDLLKQMGCDSVQGYLLGKPLPPDVAAALCQSNKGDRDEKRTRDG